MSEHELLLECREFVADAWSYPYYEDDYRDEAKELLDRIDRHLAQPEALGVKALDSRRLDWLDHHCAFVADSEYKIGPFAIGELRQLADAGIAADWVNARISASVADQPEAAPVAEEPKWWLVIDETGEPTYGSTFRSISNQHINDALDHHEIEGAKDWHLVPAYASPPSAPDRPDVPVARVTESTGTMTVVLVLEPNLPVGTLLYAGSAPDWALVEELKQIIADADADGDVRAIQFSMQTIDRIIAALESKP